MPSSHGRLFDGDGVAIDDAGCPMGSPLDRAPERSPDSPDLDMNNLDVNVKPQSDLTANPLDQGLHITNYTRP